MAPSSARRVVAISRSVRPSRGERGDVLGGDARDPGQRPRAPVVVPGRLPTASGSIQSPNASRARITSLLTASSPSTSAVGSASA